MFRPLAAALPEATSARSRRRARSLGQSMVEFALVAPLLVAVVFGVVDGGLLMFATNSVANAATQGSVVLAAEGRVSTADTTAISTMLRQGLGTTHLIAVSGVDIAHATPITHATSDDSQGDFQVSTSDVNHYQVTGGTPTLVGSAGWPPSHRRVDKCGADYAAVTIRYRYTYFFGGSTISLTSTRYVRLEPQVGSPGVSC